MKETDVKPSDSKTQETGVQRLDNGLFVKGTIISSSAKAFQRKDASGIVVRTQYEIALQPGVIVFEQYHDPKEEPTIEVDSETMTVRTFPRKREFSRVVLRAEKWRMFDKSLIITKGEFLAE